ncbi:hypothetical protein QP228_000680 [Pseudoglutamicibacter cumminsii]|uniref:hypothetical protein n=1 Tax=Pseudoglutamicibacter cumminsii TaxID=156979 RepID=UPI002556CF84|nr:hypothetical protein [Pseudoglutamicibacter cumminsii]MDZ3744543.1 hypothetical protein [Pseudoglutamicibacter cumminsii]
MKTWPAGSKCEKVIWRCGHKYKGDTKCATKHVDDERLKQVFLEAIALHFRQIGRCYRQRGCHQRTRYKRP